MKHLLLRFISGIFLLLFLSLGNNESFAQNLAPQPFATSSYAIDANGILYSFGANTAGQLGDGTANEQHVPISVPFPTGVTAWTAVAGGAGHTLAIGNDGSIYSWGDNSLGQLGLGSITSYNSPQKVAFPTGVTSWTAVAAGAYYSLAVGNDGNLYTWGSNVYGQLGIGSTTDAHVPTLVSLPNGVTGWTKIIGAGAFNSLAVGNDGNLYVWGYYGYNELPLGALSGNQLTPVKVPLPDGVTGWKAVAGGIYYTLAIGNDGNIYSCGYNTNGQLGIGYPHASPNTFVKAILPTGITGWKAVTCGVQHTLAIGNDDNLYTCGNNAYGQLGLGNNADTATFQKVALPSGVTSWKAIAGGYFYSLAVSNDDNLYSCGQNTNGELGINNTSNQSSFTQVLGVGGTGYLVLGIPPSNPVLLSPENHATNQQTSLTLKWAKTATATGYQCQVSTDPEFKSNIVVNDSTLTDTLDAVTGLGNSTTYYWRVRAYNNAGIGLFSVIDTFTTIAQAPDKPVIVWPLNNAVNLPSIDTLKCTKANGASQYNWQVRTDLNFSSLNNFVVNDTTNDTLKVVTLVSGTKYYWQVRSLNPSAASGFAGPDSFTVMSAPAIAPVLLVPVNNAIDQRTDTLIMKWNKVSSASGYECQLSDDMLFTTLIVTKDQTADTTFTFTNLQNLHKYYWRVRAFNAGGMGSFSSIDSLTTIIGVPSVPLLVSPVHATGVVLNPTFVWKAAARAETYRLQVSADSHLDSLGAFVSAVLDTALADTTIQITPILAANTKYYWHVNAINNGGVSGYSNAPLYYFTTGTGLDAVEGQNETPKEFALSQNYPNPFNPTTEIRYSIPKSAMVYIKVYDLLGQEVTTLVNHEQKPGYYTVSFNASKLASGIYIYRLQANDFTSTKKMILLK